MSLKGSRSVKYTVLSVTNVLRSFSIVLDKCQPLLSGKHHCAGLNSSLSVSLSSIRMMYVFLHEHSCFLIVTSSFLLSLSRVQTLSSTAAAIPLCHQTAPFTLPLYMFCLAVLCLFTALHPPESLSFCHASWSLHFNFFTNLFFLICVFI